MIEDCLAREVYDFVLNFIGRSFKGIKSNIADPKLYFIVSEDAIELMECFALKFGVNLEGFVISDYFLFLDYKWYDYIGMKYVYQLAYKRKPYENIVLKPLTTEHLIEVARRKEWFEPISILE